MDGWMDMDAFVVISGEIVQPQGGESAEKSPATAPTVYYCDLCNASLNSEMQYQQHMIGE